MTLIKRILKYIKPYKGRLAAGIIAMLLHSFFTIFFFNVFQRLVDTIITGIAQGEKGLQSLSWIALSMILVYFFKGIAYYGQSYLTSYVAQKAIRDIRSDLYGHLQGLSLSFFNVNKTGEIISRVTNDVGLLQNAIVNGFISVFYQFITLAGGIIYLVYLNYRLTALLLIMLPLITLIINKFNIKIRRVSKKAQIKIADISNVLQETISAVRVVKSFGREEYEYNRFREENEENFRAKVKNAQYEAVISPVVEFLAAIAFTAILWYGGFDVYHGRMAPAALITFFTVLLAISQPLTSLTKLSSTVQQALAAAERIFEILDVKNHIQEKEDPLVIEDIKGSVKFEGVFFAYKENEEVLEDINLEVNPGEVVALVGPSGAGKTTLVDLLFRFYDPDRGKIYIDEIDIKEISLASLRKHIGIVPQETVLFSGSISDNIAYGDLQASDEEIEAAARAANAHDFIMSFPEGYDTIVGERGVGLSGGQKQRIAIARAILKDAKILILDEATSALDAESEALVQDALENLMINRTTFVIAHRFSTIKRANKIVVMDKGHIVEMGDHQSLMDRKGLYYRLYQGQTEI
ncbi:MAG: ABC transporter ATP-binding protein [Halanaerobiaceae bacterium]|nr:ABC transporter ATP-binding protein [Halanaerobiaceae bacterium]